LTGKERCTGTAAAYAKDLLATEFWPARSRAAVGKILATAGCGATPGRNIPDVDDWGSKGVCDGSLLIGHWIPMVLQCW
jgi:hypothetical protein